MRVVSRSSYLVLAILVATTNGAHARARVAPPRCMRLSTVERIRISHAVFTGRVLEIQESEGIQEVKFKLSKSWKYVRTKEVAVTNYIHHEGPYFKRGNSYLVFASLQNGSLVTGGCSGTIEVEKVSYEIDELDKWQQRNKSRRGSKR